MLRPPMILGQLGIAAMCACSATLHPSPSPDASGADAASVDAGAAEASTEAAASRGPATDSSTLSASEGGVERDASVSADASGMDAAPDAQTDVTDAAACMPYSAPTGVATALPYVGADDADPSAGTGLIRSGPLLRVAGLVYSNDPLAAFHVARGFVDPACQAGLLSNPYRDDGTALNAGYAIPSTFTGHVPVFTEGNMWPFVGPNQPQPPHGNLAADAGIYLVGGRLTTTQRPLLVPGESGATIENLTPYGILVSSGSYPGDEQPGQVMTPIAPGQTVPMPIPPKGWYPDASGNPRVPELYVSVAGLDPMDVVGWHDSNTVPDYGTPGFAYTLGGKYTIIPGQSVPYLFVGFNRNEGYDPILSADPGYGVELYMQAAGGASTLVAVTDIVPLTARSARQDLWAAPQFNPGPNAQGGLSAFPNGPEGTLFAFELVTHDVAQAALQAQGQAVLHSTDSL